VDRDPPVFRVGKNRILPTLQPVARPILLRVPEPLGGWRPEETSVHSPVRGDCKFRKCVPLCHSERSREIWLATLETVSFRTGFLRSLRSVEMTGGAERSGRNDKAPLQPSDIMRWVT
jgi:hypothetical protein